MSISKRNGSSSCTTRRVSALRCYSIFDPDVAGPPADDALADEAEPDGGSGVIGATPPELAVVVGTVPSWELLAGAGTLGGVLVGPLKLIGCVPASICGVTT